jgi:ATPase subunit of ABC transporter with duplicated ATPase domains
MKGLTKTFPGAAKPVLNNIHLQFLPGTKIAIIGVNGAGKSTLMKIMAGYDTEYQGEAWAAEGIRVGYLAQEPQLDPSKDVRGNVMDGVRPVADMLDRFNAISALMADPPEDADFDALLAEMGELQEKICAARRATGRWTIFRAVSGGASRSADCCSRSPKSCCSTSLPTTSTRRASSGWKSI